MYWKKLKYDENNCNYGFINTIGVAVLNKHQQKQTLLNVFQLKQAFNMS